MYVCKDCIVLLRIHHKILTVIEYCFFLGKSVEQHKLLITKRVDESV